MSGTVIKTISLNKTYITPEKEIVALSDVNIAIQTGEFISISGASGAGKTTLLNMISALDKPTNGEVIVLGIRYSLLEEEELASFRCLNIGYVFQEYNLVSTLTARENIEFVRDIAGYRIDDFEISVQELIDQVGLLDRINHLPEQLSGGEQQRLAFARALSNDPTVLLADEPTGNLDETTAHSIYDILQRLQRNGKTILVATHDKAIHHLADRRFHIINGVVTSW